MTEQHLPPHDARVLVAKVCAIDLSVKMLLRSQIRALMDAGYRVVSVCSNGESIPELRQGGLDVYTISITRQFTPLRDLIALWRLFRFFRKCRPTVVHTHTPKAAFLGQLAAALAGVPVRINTIHGFFFPATHGIKRWLVKRLEVLTCRLAHHVFSQSQEDVELILRQDLLPKERVELIGNGIDVNRFDPSRFSKSDRVRVRQELGIPKSAFVVGILARMVREKGFVELFEAFARFRQYAPDAYLLHVGFIDRSRGDEVTPEWAQQCGILPYCRFVGQRDDVPDLLHAMDIFCLPSYREGYPRSVLEANAMGLPAIVTDIRGCREAVIDGLNGLIVPPRTVEPLVDALRELYGSPSKRMQLGGSARARALSVFDERRIFESIIRRYHILLQENLGQPGVPAPTQTKIPESPSA